MRCFTTITARDSRGSAMRPRNSYNGLFSAAVCFTLDLVHVESNRHVLQGTTVRSRVLVQRFAVRYSSSLVHVESDRHVFLRHHRAVTGAGPTVCLWPPFTAHPVSYTWNPIYTCFGQYRAVTMLVRVERLEAQNRAVREAS